MELTTPQKVIFKRKAIFHQRKSASYYSAAMMIMRDGHTFSKPGPHQRMAADHSRLARKYLFQLIGAEPENEQ